MTQGIVSASTEEYYGESELNASGDYSDVGNVQMANVVIHN